MKVIKFITVIALVITLFSCNNQKVTTKSLTNEIDSVSYALGINTAFQMKKTGGIDESLFIQGLHNGLDSTNMLIENDKIDGIIRKYFQAKQVEAREKQQEEALKKAEVEFAPIKEEGIKFLEENKTKKGVQVTESGLQYIVLKEGTGEKPQVTSKVKVHYHGTSLDGTVFDSSVDRGAPNEFFVNRVVKGWTEGLQLMNVGSKYKLFVPQELGYGAFPQQGSPIKPFQALVFEIELLEIVK